MAKTLTINNIPFEYPDKGDEPGWGGDATSWAEEVTRSLTDLIGPDDILQTAFDVANNQATLADVTGLAFNAASVRSSVITYSVYRVSDSSPSGNTETGIMHLVYDNNAGWALGIADVVGNSGVNFDITGTGQIQYTSTDIGNLNYQGVMKFSARSLQQ